MPAALDPPGLQRVMAHGWQPLETAALGGWRLRAAGGFTGRSNSALPLGPSGRPLEGTVAAVAAFYAARELPAVVQTFPGAAGLPGDELADRLAERDWTVGPPVLVMTATLADLAGGPAEPDPSLRLLAVPDPAWLRGYKYRGADLPAHAIDVLVRAERPVFAALRDRAGQAGVARGAVHDGWLGITAVTVEPDRRRQGIGARLVRGLAAWADPLGAAQAYLQVDATNEGAVALYRRLGFTVHHTYRYARAAGA